MPGGFCPAICAGVTRSWGFAVAVCSAALLLALEAPLRAEDPGPNLVTDGGFEEDVAGSVPQAYGVWRSDDRGTCTVADGVGYGSRKSLSVAGATSLACQYTIDVLPGERYLAESFCTQEGQGTPSMTIYWKDAQGQWNWPAGMTKEPYKPFEGRWRKAIARVVVPDQGVAKLTVLLCADKQESEGDKVWFDNVSLRKTAPLQKPRAYPNRILPLPAQPLLPRNGSVAQSHDEVLNTLRMGVFRYADIGEKEADEQIRKMRDEGYNAILTEGQRYLLVDTPEHPPLPDVLVGSLPFPELVRHTKFVAAACHKYGMKVYLHLTASAVPDTFLVDHPDWTALSVKDGKPSRIWGLQWACLNNEDYQKAYFQRLDLLVKESGADGLMDDETTTLLDLCGCHWCRAKFKKDTGYDMPEIGTPWLGDLESPVYRAFLEWRIRNHLETTARITAILRAHAPDGRIISYYACPYFERAWADHGASIDVIGGYADALGLEAISDYQTHWPLFMANLKLVRAVSEKRTGNIFYIKGFSDYGDIYYWWLMGLSQGAHQYWTNWLSPELKERRRPLVQWEATYESFLAGLRSAADTAVLISTRNNNLIRKPTGYINRQNSYMAVGNTLTLAQLPYRAIVDGDLQAPGLNGKAKTIIMLGVGLLSDAEAAVIREFVRKGGTLIASAETSLYTEDGTQRPDFALADVFGCSYRGLVSQGRTLVLDQPHPLLGGVSGEIDHPDEFLAVEASGSASVLGTLRAPGQADVPGLLLSHYGEGQAIYFPGHPETSLYLTEFNGTTVLPRDPCSTPRDPKMVELFCNLVRHGVTDRVTAENLPPGVVVETYTHRYGGAEGLQVHLLNLTGMMTDGLPQTRGITFPEVRPARPIRITVRGEGIRDAYMISPDFDGLYEVPLEKGDGAVFCTLPSLARYVVVYFNTGDREAVRRLAKIPLRTGEPEIRVVERRED